MTRRSSPSFAIGVVQPIFACLICGCEVTGYNHLEVRGVCEKHCGDHDFEYDACRGGHFCIHCDAEREYEPFDDDVGFASFSGSYSSGPIGVPASAMNGNAAERHKNPEAWDQWVAFCNANGSP